MALPGPRARRIALLLAPAMVVSGVFLVAGVGNAVAQSLGQHPYGTQGRLSLDAYRAAWHNPAVRASLLLTARVAGISTALATILAVTSALLLRRLGRSRSWVSGLVTSSLAVPHIVGALGIVLLLGPTGLVSRATHTAHLTGSPDSFPALTNDGFGWGIIAEYVWKEAAFLTLITIAALSSGISALEDAARVLGAGSWQRLRHVTLPLLTPVVAAGAVLVFSFAAGSYEVPYLLGRPYPATLAVVALQQYQDIDLAARPQAMAVAVLLTVLSAATVAGYLAISRRTFGRPL